MPRPSPNHGALRLSSDDDDDDGDVMLICYVADPYKHTGKDIYYVQRANLESVNETFSLNWPTL